MEAHSTGSTPWNADMAAAGALIGHRSRARFLHALADGRSRPGKELAALAGVSRATASAHLAKLVDAGLLDAQRSGRFRYYRLAGPEVARALEAILAIAPKEQIRSLRQAGIAESTCAARIDYDHLAGRLGVAVADMLEERGLAVAHEGVYALTPAGRERLERIGVVLPAGGDERVLAPACFDWSERRHHVGGSLGAAIAARVIALGWVEPHRRCNALLPTDAGIRGLREHFGIDIWTRRATARRGARHGNGETPSHP